MCVCTRWNHNNMQHILSTSQLRFYLLCLRKPPLGRIMLIIHSPHKDTKHESLRSWYMLKCIYGCVLYSGGRYGCCCTGLVEITSHWRMAAYWGRIYVHRCTREMHANGLANRQTGSGADDAPEHTKHTYSYWDQHRIESEHIIRIMGFTFGTDLPLFMGWDETPSRARACAGAGGLEGCSCFLLVWHQEVRMRCRNGLWLGLRRTATAA